MRTNWFGTRTSHLPTRERFVRPELEALEDRLPPSGMPPGNHGGDGGNSGHVMNNVHNNIHITNSFNGTGNAFNGQNLGLLAFPQSTLTGFFTMLYRQASAMNAAAASSLVADEAQLAINGFLTFAGVPGLSSTISSLQSDIAANPLESSLFGGLLGDLTFDIVLQGLVSSPLSSAAI